MESKNWSSCGYFNLDFSPGKPVSLRIWTPLDLKPPGQIRKQICTPRSKSTSGYLPPVPNPLADLDPPTKLSGNIILDVLVEIDILYVPVRTKVCF